MAARPLRSVACRRNLPTENPKAIIARNGVRDDWRFTITRRVSGSLAFAGVFNRACIHARATEEAVLHVLPHGHVLFGHVTHKRHRIGRHHGLHLLTHRGLLLDEQSKATVQIVRQCPLQRIAIESNDLRKHLLGKDRISILFLLQDDLQQDAARYVVLTARVDDTEFLTVRTNLRTSSKAI